MNALPLTWMINQPVIILVKPQMPENVGMAARAMANFGLSQLRLVAPCHPWPSEKVRSIACHADHVLDTALLFSDLSSAVSDLSFISACTARKRKDFKPVRSPSGASAILRERISSGQKAAILFGCERAGLLKEEIMLADEIVSFPSDPLFPSLNVAQAVLLMAYEWSQSDASASPIEEKHDFSSPCPAPRQQLSIFFDRLESALDLCGYFRPLEKKPKMQKDLRAVLMRPGFSDPELSVLQGVIAALDPSGRKKKKADPLAQLHHSSVKTLPFSCGEET